MRIYYGNIYDVKLALWPKRKGEFYRLMDVINRPYKEKAYVDLGYGREICVKDNAKLLIVRSNKEKVLRLPFERVDGVLRCDLSKFLSSLNIRHKMYKRTYRDCMGDECTSISYLTAFCKNGEICWGSVTADYTAYWMKVIYTGKTLRVNGKIVKKFDCDNKINEEKILEWMNKTMSNNVELSWDEFGIGVEALGISKESPLFSIEFFDGTSIDGDEIAWER